jgi:hypothetical protein
MGSYLITSVWGWGEGQRIGSWPAVLRQAKVDATPT